MVVLAKAPYVDTKSNYKIIKQRNIKLTTYLSSQLGIALEQLYWMCLG